jgi:predicted metalloprotease
MKWRDRRRSENVEDRRGQRLGTGARVGGIGGLGLLVVVVVGMLLGVDPMELLQGVPTASLPPSADVGVPPGSAPALDEGAEFVAVVLADTEDVWQAVFAASGRRYEEPVLVLFTDQVSSACGFASAATGPFYCPADQRLYIDLGFFEELRDRFQAPGDFAQAYVIAHEVGHHVQNLLGISGRLRRLQSQGSESEANRLSVALELQADCLAGVWAHHAQRTQGILEPGDIEEALGAASAVGDDRLQRRAGGTVAPDSFTHGTSAQRAGWFGRGFESGDIAACDTFSAGQ